MPDADTHIGSKAQKSRIMQLPHIGSIIRDELRSQARTNAWLAQQLGVNLRTINKIFQKEVIDTSQLMRICVILQIDFFSFYSEAFKCNCPK